jgi:hypothetical protein
MSADGYSNTTIRVEGRIESKGIGSLIFSTAIIPIPGCYRGGRQSQKLCNGGSRWQQAMMAALVY